MRLQFAIATLTLRFSTFYRFPFTLPNGTADHSPLYYDNKPSLFTSFCALLMLLQYISYLVFLYTHTTQPISPFSFSSIYSFFLCLLCHMLIPPTLSRRFYCNTTDTSPIFDFYCLTVYKNPMFVAYKNNQSLIPLILSPHRSL